MIKNLFRPKKLFNLFPAFQRFSRSYAVLFVLLFLIATTFLVVHELQSKKEIRSKAQTTCPQIPPEQLWTKPDLSRIQQAQQNLPQVQKSLLNTYNEYSHSSTSEQPQYLSILETLLSERKAYLIDLMRHAPDEALKFILSDDQISQLSQISPHCVEQQVTEEGTLEVLHADFFEEKVSQTLYTLKTINGKILQLHQAGNNKKYLMSNTKMRITGYTIDNDVLLDTNEFNNIVITSSVSPHIAGIQNVAAILVNFQNTQPDLTKEQVREVITNDVNNYYKEVSYNKVTITGDVFGWYTIPKPVSCIIDSFSEAIKLADDDIDFRNYTNVTVLVSEGNLNCGGSGSGGKRELVTNDGVVLVGTSRMGTTSNIPRLVYSLNHELGHNFGVDHASFLDCGMVSLAITGCTFWEYGDPYSVMGAFEAVGQFTAPHRELIGWFGSNNGLNNVQEVVTSGTYTIDPIETISSGRKTLKIRRGFTEYMFIEYRQPIGSDSAIIKKNPDTDVFDGALLHVVSKYNDLGTTEAYSYLIDATVLPIPYYRDPWKSVLPPGESLIDPATGTSIRTISKNPTSLTVNITLGDINFPTVSITEPQPNSTVYGVVPVRVEVSSSESIERIEFYDSRRRFATDYDPPYFVFWDTNNASKAIQNLYIKVYTRSGVSGIADSIVVSVIRYCETPVLCAPPPEGCYYFGGDSCTCGSLICELRENINVERER